MDDLVFDDQFIFDMFLYLGEISQSTPEPFKLKKIDEKILKQAVIEFFKKLTGKDLTMDYNDFLRRATYGEELEDHRVSCVTHNQIIKFVGVSKLVNFENALTHIHEFTHYYFYRKNPKMFYYAHFYEFMSIYSTFLASYLYDCEHGFNLREGMEAYHTSVREAQDFVLPTVVDCIEQEDDGETVLSVDIPEEFIDNVSKNGIESILKDRVIILDPDNLEDYTYRLSHIAAYKMLQYYKDDPKVATKLMRSVFCGGNYLEDVLAYYGIDVHKYGTYEPTIQRIRSRHRYDQ